MASLQSLNSAFNIVERMEQRLNDLTRDDCPKQEVLENLAKLYYYHVDLQPHFHWKQIKRASNKMLRGFKRLTEGTRMSDRLQLAKYEMQGSKAELICIYRQFIRDMKRVDFMIADDLSKK